MNKLISGLAELGLNLHPDQLQLFETYYRELLEWNRHINLTSITGYEDIQQKHFLDSLTVTLALDISDIDENYRILDVGAGAGMPGLPLKILYPRIKLSLLEATTKKTKFLTHITDRLGFNDIEIINNRAEEAAHQPEYRESFNAVLSRAVAPLNSLVEFTLPFCAVGGMFIAQKKADIAVELEQAEKAIGLLGGRLREVIDIELKDFEDKHCLVLIDKVSATPEKYPRHPGMPAKRPIV